jgi:hypothetical protein
LRQKGMALYHACSGVMDRNVVGTLL